MAGERREVVVYFRGVERDLVRSTGASERSLRGFAGTAVKAGIAVAGAFAARQVVSEIGKSIKATSDLREAQNKTNVIFGGSGARLITAWASDAALQLGLTRTQALQNAASFGDMFDQLGIGRPKAIDMSKSMVQLAADFASFHNADITQVLEAQSAAFRGEYDSVQRFVPGITAARVEQEALRLTHKKSAQDLTAAEKAQATYNIMLRDGRRAQGDFARTSTDLANAQRIAKAQVGEMREEIGGAFLPAARTLTNHFNTELSPEILRFARENSPAMGVALDNITKKFLDSAPSAREFGAMLRSAFAWVQREGPQAAERLGQLIGKLVEARPQFAGARAEAGALGPTLKVSGAIMQVLAQNIDVLIRHLPLLVAAFVAYKGAQAAANVAQTVQVGLLPAQIAGNFALARSNRTLAASLGTRSGATGLATGAQTANTVATNLGTGATLRERAASLASAAAKGVVTVATRAYTAGQWLLNAALTANPIGIVIALLVALGAGIVLAYRRSETFRRIVQGAWRGIQAAASAAWGVTRRVLANLIEGFIKVAGSIVRSAATAFGWVPGVGPKLRQAAAKFGDFQRIAQGHINRLRGRSVTVTAKATFQPPPGMSMRSIVGALAEGGPVRGPGTSTSDSVLAVTGSGRAFALSDGEYVVNARAYKQHRQLVEAINEDRLPGGITGRAMGGGVTAQWRPTPGTLGTGIYAFNAILPRVASVMGKALKSATEEVLSKALGGALGSGRGMGWQWQMRVLRAAFPGMQLISGYRPGAITATGNRSYHGMGRAVDIPPVMGYFNFIRAHYGRNTRELIFSPAGNRQIHNGRPHYYSGITRANHWDHIHWAMAKGGAAMLRRPAALMDLASGMPLALMGENGPERLSVTPASARDSRVDTSGAAAGGVILVDLTLTIDGQVLERRLERVRAKRDRRRPGQGGLR